jgi:hypothetical protein
VFGSSAKRPEPSGINAMRFVHQNSTGQPCSVSQAYDGNVQMIDSTSVRVHQHAANSKKATRIAVWVARAAG